MILTSSLLDRVESVLERRVIEANKTIYKEGDDSTGAYIVRRGAVGLYQLSADNKQVLVRKITEGMMFGDLALLQQRYRKFTAYTLGQTELVVVPYAFVKNKLSNVDPFVRHWIEYLVTEVNELRTRNSVKGPH